jgi:hypothetical protein
MRETIENENQNKIHTGTNYMSCVTDVEQDEGRLFYVTGCKKLDLIDMIGDYCLYGKADNWKAHTTTL